jgi:hypothetical protein
MVLSFDQQFLMSAQVFAVKRFYPVWASGTAIGRTGFYLHRTTTAKPGTGFFQLYNHYSSQKRLFSSTES